MKKILTILIILQVSFTAFAVDTYFEKNLSFYSAKILSMGNTFVASANGLESFEYNPAGIAGEKSLTLIHGNFNLISNLVQLNDDLIKSYNDAYPGSNRTSIEYGDLGFYLGTENRRKIIGALLNQTSTPYKDNEFANGLGYSSSLSLGYAGEGFGIGLLVSMDSEVFGEELHTTELDSVLTASLLLGYGMSIDLGIIGLDVGIGVRPMYKVRSTSKLAPVVDYLLEDTDSDADFIADLDYLTGVGIGFDLGAKAYFMGLSVGVALIDIFGTSIVYTKNTYENIMNGKYLGSEVVEDEYITPTTLKLGISINPGLGSFSKVFNPTISADYNVLFIDEGSVEDYAVAASFWNSLSLGAEVELFSFIHLRAGLNQGYVTAGIGLDLFILEINLGVYSRELGEEVGDRQQMGAALEMGIKL